MLFPNPSDPGRRNKAEDEIKGEPGFKNKAGDEIKAKIGWQYQTEEEIKAEIGFLVRCFAYLPKSKGQHWPLNANEQNDWTKTITYWLHYNAIDGPKFTDTPTGLLASESFYEEERFFHQIFKDSTGEPMYYFITVARMAHAVDPREIRIGWEFCQANVHLFCCMNFNCSNIKHQFF